MRVSLRNNKCSSNGRSELHSRIVRPGPTLDIFVLCLAPLLVRNKACSKTLSCRSPKPITSKLAMSDEDEFAFVDWNDATLAELSATEQRISYQLAQTQVRPQSTQSVPPTKPSLVRPAHFGDPPAKRLKPNNSNPNAPSCRYISLNTEDDTAELEVFAGSDGRARIFDPRVPPRTTSLAVPSKQITNATPTSSTSHGPIRRRLHVLGRPPPLASQQLPSVDVTEATTWVPQGRGEVIRPLGPPVLDSSVHRRRPPSPVPQSTRTDLPSSQRNNQVDAELSRLRAELAQVC
jgi:hypothetical protein